MLQLDRRACLAVLLGAPALACRVAVAGTLPRPSGKVILRISGNIANRNSPEGADFDADMLERLGLADLVTRTPWTDGEPRFTGVPADRLLETVGASGQTLEVVTRN